MFTLPSLPAREKVVLPPLVLNPAAALLPTPIMLYYRREAEVAAMLRKAEALALVEHNHKALIDRAAAALATMDRWGLFDTLTAEDVDRLLVD